MDWFNHTPIWHPRYQVEVAEHDVTLLDGDGMWRFTALAVRQVAALIAQNQSLAKACEHDPAWLAHAPTVLHALAQLAQQGWVVDAATAPVGWAVPDFGATPVWLRISPVLELACLSTRLAPETALSWAAALAPLPTAVRLVLCDDYFDPRLAQLDAECRAAGMAWLPLRVAGDTAWLGPWFGHEAGQPCWHCLDARLMRNQPVRAWWRSRPAGQRAGLPESHQPDATALRLRLLAEALVRHGPNMPLVTVGQNGEMRAHPSPRRPQCPACGDPDVLAARQAQPLRLAPARKLAGVAGGARTQTSQDTVTRLLAEVSPLTGVVADVRLLPGGGAMPVHHSQFFRPWRSDGAPRIQAQSCLGKGASEAQSCASALCEAVERYAAAWQGDEAMRLARAAELPAPAITPDMLSFFSAEQRASARPGERAAQRAYDPQTPQAWTPAWSLTENALRYLPLAACYADAPTPWADFAGWSSNGCASGNCREEAILQGLLEVIERDAVAIWWYNMIPRPQARCAAAAQARAAQALGPAWRCWLLDLTHDLGVPVLAAIAWREADGAWALGFGASLSAELAAERALTELVQLVAADKCLTADAVGQHAGFLWPAGERAPQDAARHEDIVDDILCCVAAWRAQGHEVIVHDYSRPDIALATVKVVTPGACHIWPERANPRLFAAPVALGWLAAPLAPEALNFSDLYV